jgi:hypothetical protein
VSIRAVLIWLSWLSVALAWVAILQRQPSFTKPVMVTETGKDRGPISLLRRSKDGKLLKIENVSQDYQVGFVFRLDNGCDYKVTERWQEMDGLFSIYAEIEKVKQ